MEVQVVPSGEVWIWNAVAYAASQFSVTWQMDWVEPRSTSSHCGSEKALDQRVPRLPSTAFEAGEPAFSREDAVAVLFRARLVVPHVASAAAGIAAGSTSPVRISGATAASKNVRVRRCAADLGRPRPGRTALRLRAGRRRGGGGWKGKPPGGGGTHARD